MINNQEYITTKLEKILYEILPITSKRLKNLVYIIIGIILSKSVVKTSSYEPHRTSHFDKIISMWRNRLYDL